LCGIESTRYSNGPDRSPGPDYSTSFHTWTLIWTPDDIAVFVDYELVRKCSRSGNLIDNCLPFGLYPNNPMHVIVGLAAHSHPCTPNGTNAVFEVDYVKIWDSTTPSNCDGESLIVTPASNYGGILHYSNFIHTVGSVTLSQNTSTIWTAGNYIDLMPGFEVNGIYEANITPCMADCWFCRAADSGNAIINESDNVVKNKNSINMTSGKNNSLVSNLNSYFDNINDQNNSFTINESATIAIYNAEGQLLLQKNYDKMLFDAEKSFFAPGVYVIKLHSKSKTIIKKWIKL
jgi:hypothetical protein